MRGALLTFIVFTSVFSGSCLRDPDLAYSYSGDRYSPSGATSVWQATVNVRHAKAALAKAKRRLAETQAILAATKRYNEAYGTSVGRWVRLSRVVGWPWADFPTLFRVMDAESGGSPTATNSSSGCAGLMQLAPGHWEGKFDPYVPRLNLAYSLKLRRASGWSPWVTY